MHKKEQDLQTKNQCTNSLSHRYSIQYTVHVCLFQCLASELTLNHATLDLADIHLLVKRKLAGQPCMRVFCGKITGTSELFWVTGFFWGRGSCLYFVNLAIVSEAAKRSNALNINEKEMFHEMQIACKIEHLKFGENPSRSAQG